MVYLPFVLLALACPIGMVVMMLLMGRMMGMGKHEDARPEPVAGDALPADPEKRLAVLQAQRQLLDAQIAAAEDGPARAESPAEQTSESAR